MGAPPSRWGGPRRLAAAAGVVAALAVGGLLPAATPAGAAAAPADVVLVTFDCAGNFLCPPFTKALRATGARGRIIQPDFREDPADTLSLIAQQGHDLVITGFLVEGPLGEVAPRFPRTRFAFFDGVFSRRLPNVESLVLRPNEAAFLAGWLAARLERNRPGRDVVGAVGGAPIAAVRDFIVGFTAGARRASPQVTVLTDYSNDFVDPSACEAVARRQIARGAGAVFDVAGGCGIGTLRAAKRAGVWGIGVDSDRSALGPHILTSVLKGYDVGFVRLIRQAQRGDFRPGGTIRLGLAQGGSGLGRLSPRVPPSVRIEVGAIRRRVLSGEIRVPGVAGR